MTTIAVPYGGQPIRQGQHHQVYQNPVIVKKQVVFQQVYDSRGCCHWLGNLLWLLLGGWHLFLTWFTVGVCLCITVIGIPCGIQVIKISIFLLFPFGKSLIYTDDNIKDEGTQCCFRTCNCCFNVLWATTVGWILALQAILTGIVFMLTIWGIPFGIQCCKLAVISFRPFGLDFTATTAEEITTNYYQGRI
mmetsp:Transcript_19323/g.28597  ORF Transcript_19323/g.28597 Transcript_19323/m.28597 type:complete len:191 (-) Transcript_19323:319-891(-)